jgi:hypothetical protein
LLTRRQRQMCIRDSDKGSYDFKPVDAKFQKVERIVSSL